MLDGSAAQESTLQYIEEFAGDVAFRHQILLALMRGLEDDLLGLYTYSCEVGELRRHIQIKRIKLMRENQ